MFPDFSQYRARGLDARGCTVRTQRRSIHGLDGRSGQDEVASRYNAHRVAELHGLALAKMESAGEHKHPVVARVAAHLLKFGGYRTAGFVHAVGMPFYSTERMAAFRQTMKRNKLETVVLPDGGDLRAWVRKLQKPAAVMAASDIRAADLIIACRQEGISVPNQVEVVGVDNDVAQHERCGMSISSVIVDFRAMGVAAIRELDFLFRHPNFRGRLRETLFPAKRVFIGESSMRSTTAVRLAEKALNLIDENLTNRISPTEIALRLGCSRQFADRCLSAFCGKPLHKAIGAKGSAY